MINPRFNLIYTPSNELIFSAESPASGSGLSALSIPAPRADNPTAFMWGYWPAAPPIVPYGTNSGACQPIFPIIQSTIPQMIRSGLEIPPDFHSRL